MRRRWVRSALVIAIALTCYYSWICYRVPAYYGFGNWWTIARADSVLLYRIDSLKYREGARSIEQMAIAGPIKPKDQWVDQVVTLLGDSRNYSWDIAKACAMMPGVALRFKKGESTTDVRFCFECRMLSIGQDSGRAKAEDFDPMNDELIELMKEALPKDPVIQSLTYYHRLKQERQRRR